MVCVYETEQQQSNGVRSLFFDENSYITIGIIDYMQDYNQSKILETKVKSFLRMFKPRHDISCIDSQKYQKRFVEFCEGFLI